MQMVCVGIWGEQESVECVWNKCEGLCVFVRDHQAGPASKWETSGAGKSAGAWDVSRGSSQTDGDDAQGICESVCVCVCESKEQEHLCELQDRLAEGELDLTIYGYVLCQFW